MSKFDKNAVVTFAAVGIGVLMLALAGVANYVRGASIQAVADQEQQLLMLQRQLDQVRRKPVTPPIHSSARWQLSAGPQVVMTMQIVQALADESSVELDGLTAMRSADDGKQAFSVSGHGAPEKICGFVAAIEQDNRLMILETGRLVAAQGEQVAFQFGLATYYQGGAK